MTSIYISEDSGENRARRILDRLAQTNVAGVAYDPYSANIHQQSVDRLMLAGKPVVLMDIPSPCKRLTSVSCDNLSGSMELTRHLIALGHTVRAARDHFRPLCRVSARVFGGGHTTRPGVCVHGDDAGRPQAPERRPEQPFLGCLPLSPMRRDRYYFRARWRRMSGIVSLPRYGASRARGYQRMRL